MHFTSTMTTPGQDQGHPTRMSEYLVSLHKCTMGDLTGMSGELSALQICVGFSVIVLQWIHCCGLSSHTDVFLFLNF